MKELFLSAFGVAVFVGGWSASGLGAEKPPLAVSLLKPKQAKEIQERWTAYLGRKVAETNSIGMKMVLIPPGEFTMGRTEQQFDRILALFKNDEKLKKNYSGMLAWSMLLMPAHRVRITKPFYMGACEVTVAQFRQFARASGYKTEAEQGLHHGKPIKRRPVSTWQRPHAWRSPRYVQKDNEPVLHLCWNDCVAFCEWLSKTEGKEYCLPTEAEWEYACRAGTTTPWSFGGLEDFDRVADEHAWWSDGPQGKHDRPRPVGLGKPNAFGLYDMHGNLWEYVADWWHRLYYKESPINDPTGPAVQSEKGDLRRIIRGSSYDWGRWGGDSSYRMRITQRSNQHPHMGFRIAMRIKGVEGVPPAVDPDEQRRRKRRDPGPASVDAASAAKHPKERRIDLRGGVNIEFVLIPPGSFLMGSERGPKDERPIHRVVISRPFYMAKREVTQQQWEAVMGKHPRLVAWRKKPNDLVGPRKPMAGLSWADCQRFIGKLKEKAPQCALALPTEAQWEYASRAGSAGEYCFGDDESRLADYAWYAANKQWPGEDGAYHRYNVATKKPNAFGLYDMHGGVWEWCADRYDRDYYLTSPVRDPKGPESGRFRVLRGGSWFRYGKYARSAYRRFFHPECDGDGVTAWILDFGCRLVINAERAERKVNHTQLARSLVRYPHNPVIKVGKKGAWDDQTLGCFTVLHDGGRFYFYSGGTQYGKPKKIGMATSSDGIHWTKYEKNPLFPGSMPYAIKVGDTFRLYHPGKDDAGSHGLQMRTSKDGFNWSKPNRVLAGGIMDPCVVPVNGKYHLYYCGGGRRTKNGKQVWEFKAYTATSPDGIRWKKEPKPALPLGPKGSWDEQSHAGPCVLKLDDGFHMWYLGSGAYKDRIAWRIGHATSQDGLNWTKSGKDPVLDIGKAGAWDCGTFMSFDIIFRDGKFLFWYAGAPTGHGDETKMTIQIGHGTNK